MSVLPDVLKLGLKVVFCGTSVGNKSAKAAAYYAGPGNQFWNILSRIGLTPRQLNPQEFRSLLQYGIGLTDLVKERSGNDDELVSSDFDRDGLIAKIEQFQPKALAFNGKRASKAFFDNRHIDYGRQPKTIGSTALFVLPSTSGAARKYWDETHWQELANFVAR